MTTAIKTVSINPHFEKTLRSLKTDDKVSRYVDLSGLERKVNGVPRAFEYGAGNLTDCEKTDVRRLSFSDKWHLLAETFRIYKGCAQVYIPMDTNLFKIITLIEQGHNVIITPNIIGTFHETLDKVILAHHYSNEADVTICTANAESTEAEYVRMLDKLRLGVPDYLQQEIIEGFTVNETTINSSKKVIAKTVNEGKKSIHYIKGITSGKNIKALTTYINRVREQGGQFVLVLAPGLDTTMEDYETIRSFISRQSVEFDHNLLHTGGDVFVFEDGQDTVRFDVGIDETMNHKYMRQLSEAVLSPGNVILKRF